jgi:hypothetical protein
MFTLIIVSLNVYGAVVNAVPNLTKIQCEAMQDAIAQVATENRSFLDHVTVITKCTQTHK